MALLDVELSIGLCNFCAILQVTGISAQAHRAAQVGDALLLLHQVDDVVRGLGVDLYAVGIGHAQHVAGILNDHALHAVANAKRGDIMLAAPLQGGKLALGASLAKARRHYHAVHLLEQRLGIAVVDLLARDIGDLHFVVLVNTSGEKALVDALVGILELHILAHQPYLHLLAGVVQLVEEVVPLGQVGLATVGGTSLLEDDLVQALAMHHQRHLIDARRVEALSHCVGAHVAKLRHLAAVGGRHLTLGAKHEHVGLDTHLLQLLHTVLRGLGLELASGLDVGNIGQVNHHAVAAKLPLELAHRLKERQRLNVAHRATYLGDYKVILASAAQQLHAALDLVGDVRNDLHSLPQVVATALLVDDALVHSAGCDIVGASGLDVGKALIMAQVQVGLVTIDGNVALAVLIGV